MQQVDIDLAALEIASIIHKISTIPVNIDYDSDKYVTLYMHNNGWMSKFIIDARDCMPQHERHYIYWSIRCGYVKTTTDLLMPYLIETLKVTECNQM